jgi:hypothetical protein
VRQTLALAALLCLLAPAAHAQSADVVGVREAFAEYRAAAAVQDGAAAYARVDSVTRAYYDQMAALARHAPAEEVRALPFAEQLTVLAARLRIPADTLEGMDGQGFFVHAVDQGWVGREFARAALGPVEVRGDLARAQARQGEQMLPHELTFRREEGVWRLDLVAMLQAASMPMNLVIRQAGYTPTAFALQLLAQETGSAVPESVWTPPVPR